MIIRISDRSRFTMCALLLFIAALVSVRAQASDRSDSPSALAMRVAPPAAAAAQNEGDARTIRVSQTAPRVETAPVVLQSRPARIVMIQGVVHELEEGFFGQTKRVAILSVSDEGILLENPVEDIAAGAKLKDHVGEGVLARALIKVKADGSTALLVDSFELRELEALEE